MAQPSPLHLALESLLPHISNGKIPPRLLNLATSLHNQSHQKLPNLKPEEEIARPYVCAEIAVTKLQAALKLDVAKSRPPCKPAVYKKLLKLAEGVLSVSTPLKSRATTNDATEEASSPTPAAKRVKLSNNEAPTKSNPGARFQGRIVSGSASKSSTKVEEAPKWTISLLRRICTHLSISNQPAPHAYTGSCIILRRDRLWPPAHAEQAPTESSEANDHLPEDVPAVILAIFLLVLTKMQKGEMTDAMYENVSSLAIRLTRSALSEQTPEQSGADETMLDAAKLKTRIEHWICEISEKEWCEGEDWWDSVPDEILELPASLKTRRLPVANDTGVSASANSARTATRSTAAVDDHGDGDNREEDDDDDLNTSLRAVLRHSVRHQRSHTRTQPDPTLDPALHNDNHELDLSNSDEDDDEDEKDGVGRGNILLPGLGTMLQEAVDWNSRERRVAGQRWREGMLRRIKALEGVGSGKRAVQVR